MAGWACDGPGTTGDLFSDASHITADAEPVRRLKRLRRGDEDITLSTVVGMLRDERENVVGFTSISRDVTELSRATDELRLSNENLVLRERQMRALTRRLNAVREEEQKRLSRQVHDELGQLLTGLKMDIRWLTRRFAGPSAERDEPAIRKKLSEANEVIDATIGSVQRIALELRPSALDALGIAAALRDEARRFEARSGVEVALDVDVPSLPSAELSTMFFRVFQELLTNVARHAHASRVEVTLRQTDGAWLLRVEDDGAGLGALRASTGESLGVLGMRERVEAVGGQFALEGGRSAGTVATARVPIAAQRETACSTF